jgi:hypothetical protein
MKFLLELATKESATALGLENGSLYRVGGIIRDSQTHEIVEHLKEISFQPKDLLSSSLSPSFQMSQLSSVTNIVGLGVSIVGFAYMAYKLNKIEKSINDLKNIVINGISHLSTKLDDISNQLGYISQLLQVQLVKQDQLNEELVSLHNSIMINNLADLLSAVQEIERFPQTSEQGVIKIANKCRLFFANELQKSSQKSKYEKMISNDFIFQILAISTSIEVHFLVKLKKYSDAIQVIDYSYPILDSNIAYWIKTIIFDEDLPKNLQTVYRYKGEFNNAQISNERFNRLLRNTKQEASLSVKSIFEKEINIEVELMKDKNPPHYNIKQLVTAEFLDGLIEIKDRIGSSKYFLENCVRLGMEQTEHLFQQIDHQYHMNTQQQNNESKLFLIKFQS